MFFIGNSDYTLFVFGLIGAAIFFLLQLLFCFKTKRLAVKLIPAYLILLGLFYCLGTWLGLFGTYSLGDIAGHQIVALVLTVVVGIAALGELLAWVIYGWISFRKPLGKSAR